MIFLFSYACMRNRSQQNPHVDSECNAYVYFLSMVSLITDFARHGEIENKLCPIFSPFANRQNP